MYYKAILYDTGSFEVKDIPDEEAQGLSNLVYNGYDEEHYIFAIRKNKEDAIYTLKEYILEEIIQLQSDMYKLRKLLGFIK